ncbi:hypothetical protein HMPREF1982_04295 [Clostridiales bacterium oral taxon 876 str. F0540]|nr:hypothetical protein HMPREF1982_04295 [Clostridiales bacterium oral taxon 876 str. F0540]
MRSYLTIHFSTSLFFKKRAETRRFQLFTYNMEFNPNLQVYVGL